ncbi:MAG: LamG domain-containing protein, partial [Janthinobacterium lividum]
YLNATQVLNHYNAGSPSNVASYNPTTYATAAKADSPILYWPLDDSTPLTTIVDSANSSHHGFAAADTTAGITSVTDGARRGVHFPAASSITTSQTYTAPTQFSVEVWVRTNSTSGGKILGFGSGIRQSSSHDRNLYMRNDGTVSFGINTSAGLKIITSTATINDGAWHHLVATFGAAKMILYVDGSLVGTLISVTSSQTFTGRWHLGGDTFDWAVATTNSSDDYVDAVLDDVAVYSSVLTADRVSAHLAAGSRTTPASYSATTYAAAVSTDAPIVWWPLDVTTPTGTVPDKAIPTNVGIVTGDAYQVGQPGALFGSASATTAAYAGGGGQKQTGVSAGPPAIVDPTARTAPDTFSLETWFKTSSPISGQLAGFGASATAASGTVDRVVWIGASGALNFGVGTTNSTRTTITAAGTFNDGAWHHVIATMGAAGTALYVDGTLRASGSLTNGPSYAGYWRFGGDTGTGWTDTTLDSVTSSGWGYFVGLLDEPSVYSSQLSAQQVSWLFHANHSS